MQNELLFNLVSEWTFDNPEKLGEDTWGSNHGTLMGTEGAQNLPQLQPAEECVYGTCLKFDGTDDYIDLGNASIPNPSLTPKTVTIALWMYRFPDSSDRRLFSRGAQGGAGATGYHLDHNRFIIFKNVGDSGRCDSPAGNTLSNQWVYLVGSYDGTTVRFYQNGKEAGLGTNCPGQIVHTSSSTNKAVIGALGYLNTLFFKGMIDDIHFYNIGLSSAQIKQNYIAGLDSLLNKGTLSKEEYNERLQALANN